MSEQVHATGPMYRPSRSDDQGIDAGTRRILYLMGAGGLVVLAGIAIYSLAGRSHGDVVPVVQASQGPIRVKPENPGGMTVTPEATRVDPNDSHLAPATEEPNPHALLAITGPAKGSSQPAALMLAPPHPRSFTVQLSAAKSEAQAQLDWDKLAKRLPELFRDHRALFQKTNEPGPAPWRLRTGGFADPAQAKTFCDKVKAKGGQCTVVES